MNYDAAKNRLHFNCWNMILYKCYIYVCYQITDFNQLISQRHMILVVVKICLKTKQNIETLDKRCTGVSVLSVIVFSSVANEIKLAREMLSLILCFQWLNIPALHASQFISLPDWASEGTVQSYIIYHKICIYFVVFCFVAVRLSVLFGLHDVFTQIVIFSRKNFFVAIYHL